MKASTSPEKRTNVRSSIPAAITKTGVAALQSVAPEAAARAAAHLFFRAKSVAPRPGETEVLSNASAFTVRFGSESLAAWSWGQGPAVLLVHGWNGRATQLGGFVEPLVASGFRVVAFDHVGHGASTGSSTSLVQMADAIACVAQVVGGAFAVVAHSLGAGASVLAMHDGLAIDRAVLIAPPLAPDPWLRRLGHALGLDEHTLRLTRAECERRAGRTFDELQLPRLAKSLRQPALIVHDRDDREIPIEAGELLSYAWQGSRFVVTAGLGHMRVLRSPGVIEWARRFLLRGRSFEDEAA